MQNRLSVGLIQVYTGNSKGKTTAALGLGLRAVGHGLKVGMVQFLKGTTYSGEIYATERLYPSFQIFSYGRGCPTAAMIKSGESVCNGCMKCFVMPEDIQDSDINDAVKALEKVKQLLESDRFDLVILDEISAALNLGIISEEDLKRILMGKAKHIEMVLTGRNMPEWVLEMADLVTEMVQIKHPFEKGILGRRGIEY